VSRSIYWKITIPLTLLVLVGMVILGFYVASSTRNNQINQLETEITNEAKLIAYISLPVLADATKQDQLDGIAKTTGQQIQARITIIANDGTVLADNEQNPQMMENHASRPEVIQALSTGVGQSIRYSATLHEDMMYVAVPIVNQGQVLGIARVALPLTAIQTSIDDAVRTIVPVMAVVTILVVLAAALLARMITSPVRQITRVAEGIAAGNFEQQIPIRTSDEIGRLGRVVNEMSSNLKTTVATITDERGKLVAVLSGLTDGIVMTDSEENVMLVNPAAERLFNFRESKITGRPLIEAVQDYEIDNAVKKCLKTFTEQTTLLDSPTGRFLRVIVVPIVFARSTAALVLFQDLTELRNLQTMRRELVGNISHELRTPIAGIKVMVETLKGSASRDKGKSKDLLNRIDNEVDQLTQIVSELTELSRIESGRAELRLNSLNLNLLVKEAVAQLNSLAQKQKVTMSIALDNDLPNVEADKERIRQTIVNLVHNAIKFNHPGGEISISTKTEGDFAVVSISDNGIGISKDDLPHVFERFYKADKSRSKDGSGLGLAIAKHTIQAHAGNIWAKSREGEGSTFSFSLPFKQLAATTPKI
jgi:two-component system phosphate regulon sensor histidine kinase PhoR